jgi:hypothetical protein
MRRCAGEEQHTVRIERKTLPRKRSPLAEEERIRPVIVPASQAKYVDPTIMANMQKIRSAVV